ncbi:MAG: hypothetical protein GYB53_05610 [Rhodobacteraceae bacterium]|nr:hypothetical protein [Paracoccaceae bacterium]MBR9821782.1 hypothetical protein [Paracoccaceae bacterium]
MQDITAMLAQLKRPGLLVTAARLAARDYRRERHLPGLLGPLVPRRHGAAALDLMEREAELDALRREGSASYSPLRHVRLLAALIGEAQLMAATPPQAPGA